MKDAGAVVISVESPRDSSGAHAVLHDGVRGIAELAARQSCRLVLVSQIYITRPHAMPGFEGIVAARALGEQAVRDNGAPYTIVRPSWLTDDPAATSGLRLEQGDAGEGQVSVADVAAGAGSARVGGAGKDVRAVQRLHTAGVHRLATGVRSSRIRLRDPLRLPRASGPRRGREKPVISQASAPERR